MIILRKPKWGIAFFFKNKKDICFRGFQFSYFFYSILMFKNNSFNCDKCFSTEDQCYNCARNIEVSIIKGENNDNFSR